VLISSSAPQTLPPNLSSLPLLTVSRKFSFAVPTRTCTYSIRQPKKDKPKPATSDKAAPAAGKGRGEATRGRSARGGRGGGRERQKKKTIEELDAEMADYFPGAEGGNDAMATNGAAAAPAAAVGDTAMDDEML
jgi:THO complex subunit 4